MAKSGTEGAAPASGGWRFRAGIAMFIAATALWLIVPLAALAGAPSGRIAALTGIVFVGNKVMLLACIAIMGKAGFQRLKSLVFGYAKGLAPGGFGWLGRLDPLGRLGGTGAPAVPVGPVGPVRHAIGLVMFCVPLVWAVFGAYVDLFWPGLRPNVWPLQALGDAVLIASFFVLGGEFWNKIRALFVRSATVVDARD
jgi:hypothetical protein